MSEDELYKPSTGLAAVAFLVVLYSILVANRPLTGVIVVIGLFSVDLLRRFLHLAERLVWALERIADAMEAETGT